MADEIHVLYVDDEPSLLEIGKIYLERSGQFHVDIMTSASEALALLNLKNYDAIISDYQMQEMNGIDFLKRVRTSGKTIPFILFTGKGREEVVIEAINNGADFYLQKGGALQPQFAELTHKILQAVQRQKADLALGESECRYRDVVETQTEFISRFKPDGTHVFANEAYCRHFGKRRDEIIGQRFVPLIPEEDRDLVRRHFASLTQEHPVAEVEHRVIMPDLSIRWHWWNDHAIFDDRGTVIEYQSLGKDITNRKQTEDALQESNEKYRMLFENAGDGIIICDHNVFLDCNKRAEEIYRCTRDQLIGYSPLDFSPGFQPDGRRSAEEIRKKIDAAFLGENQLFEWVHVHPDNTPFIVDISLSRIIVGGIYYIQAIIRDITDRKQNEEQTAHLSALKEKLLGMHGLKDQLKLVSDSCVTIFDADFARIWLIKNADLCEGGCKHASVTDGPDVCHNRSRCLHLMVSSGRYTHINGDHRRVPFGCYKIGRVASGEDPYFISNDVVHDPRVHDHTWAQSTGLVSFAGFRLMSTDKKPIGVFALFRKREILPREEKHLVDLANTLSHVIISGMSEEALRESEAELRAACEHLAAAEEELRGQYEALRDSQQQIQQSEERYRTIVENIQDVVYRSDRKGTLIMASPSWAVLLGYENIDECLGKNIALEFYMYPEIRQNFLDALYRDGAVKDYEVVLRKRDGTPVTVSTSSHICYNESGAELGIEGVFRDITDRKMVEEDLYQKNQELNSAYEQLTAVEEEIRTNLNDLENSHKALAESKATLDSIIGESPIPQFVIDRNHRITHWNKALEEYSGVKAQTVLGTTEQWRAFYDNERPCLADLLLKGDEEKISAWYEGKFKKSILIDDAFEAVDFFPRMTGEGKWLYFTAGLVRDPNGKVIGAVETLEDITDRKMAEKALREANKKLNLLSNITRHDILNHLTGLKGYLELSKDFIHRPAKLGEFIDKEIKAAESIEEQIGFTRYYQNMGVNAPIWQNVNASISRAIASLPMRNLQVVVDFTDLEVLADPLLEKVFYNLADNALRYGGKKLTTLHFSSQESNRGMIIVYENDGVGISRNVKGHLFERGVGKHTGLGLNLVREITGITGITISEAGKCRKGVRFEIVVPAGAWRVADKKSTESALS
ncbi:PAS domain S-box protein [uncultured Methanoregula sp.]|uniref:PAS domain S-box protein n=1 Tax=uncultured Methanoregula sp. TaxID=1005933 RepID=UPI002AABE252|nr:PAS domain S-box protein [uncultured Methanoregula sp.]